MRRFLLFAGIAVVIIIIIATTVAYYFKAEEKSRSPEEHVIFNDQDLTIKVFYNRPFKKGREIFGGLVPYGKVWRTGANEATTFETTKELHIEGKVLKRGKYTLWTIPREGSWTVIFNAQYGQWGINSDGEANRDPANDVLTVDVHAVKQDREFEQFTITFEKIGGEAEMILMWDKTLVAMPFSY